MLSTTASFRYLPKLLMFWRTETCITLLISLRRGYLTTITIRVNVKCGLAESCVAVWALFNIGFCNQMEFWALLWQAVPTEVHGGQEQVVSATCDVAPWLEQWLPRQFSSRFILSPPDLLSALIQRFFFWVHAAFCWGRTFLHFSIL